MSQKKEVSKILGASKASNDAELKCEDCEAMKHPCRQCKVEKMLNELGSKMTDIGNKVNRAELLLIELDAKVTDRASASCIRQIEFDDKVMN